MVYVSAAPWNVDQSAIFDHYVRSALHSVINGTHYKLVVGECAGWDTDSINHPPPNWTPPPRQIPDELFGRCGQQPTCTKQTPGNTTCEPPLAKDQHMGSSCFNQGQNSSWGCPPHDPLGTPFLFDLDHDEGEYCDLYSAMPGVAREMLRRLDRYKETEVPVRFPNLDPSMNPGACHPPLDFWFARDETNGSALVCGRAPPAPPAPGPGAVRFQVARNSSACLVAPGSGYSAWLVVGTCTGNRSLWRQVSHPQLESVAFPGFCLNVFGGPPSCCPGGAHSEITKFHMTPCGSGPGNRFDYDGHGHIALDAAKWRECAGLCVVPTIPLVTLGNCSAEPWKRVTVPLGYD